MALTRAFLKGLQLSEEQVAAIIEAHTETVDGLKSRTNEIQAKLDSVSGWEKKYNDLNTEFENFKTSQSEKEVRKAKEEAYDRLLEKSGIANGSRRKAILRISNMEDIKLNKDGSIHDEDKLVESIKSDYADFIPAVITKGADVPTPPTNSSKMTKDQIMSIKDSKERQKQIAENLELFK